MHGRFILQGITVSVLGAFLWVSIYLHSIYEGRDRFLVVLISAFLGLVLASFYVIPLGVLLGITLPGIAHRKPLPFCLLLGFASGIAIAGVTSVLVAVAFKFGLRSSFVSMCPVCSILIMGWMFLLWRNRVAATEPEPVSFTAQAEDTEKVL